ncbi:hypothetical protein GZH82_13580 [Staphylococcus ursi]|uniref:hypothetical protein n=1 Tax=Staphylococcus sp. MI 10-1553 TaxID=1912064 RepID=UPI001398918B|nr:hypothetical protein [Staphylococcus sp. MI 10-1553]QHW38272.1 hypothetical protein GZH82_13580 [Staphylococcus sp. MI 10-1553]
MLSFREIEHKFQLESYNLNTVSLSKIDENTTNFESPYKVSSDQIEFKIYPMADDFEDESIPILIRFIIKNEDFKLELEYKALYSSKLTITSDFSIDSIEPVVFFTMSESIKNLSISIIKDVVNCKVDFPTFDKSKLSKINDE